MAGRAGEVGHGEFTREAQSVGGIPLRRIRVVTPQGGKNPAPFWSGIANCSHRRPDPQGVRILQPGGCLLPLPGYSKCNMCKKPITTALWATFLSATKGFL